MSNNNKNQPPKLGSKHINKYDYAFVEIFTDIDKNSETYGSKYMNICIGDYIDGRIQDLFHIEIKDRFAFEHHTLEQKDQIKETKHKCQTLYSRDFDNSI